MKKNCYFWLFIYLHILINLFILRWDIICKLLQLLPMQFLLSLFLSFFLLLCLSVMLFFGIPEFSSLLLPHAKF